MLMNFLQLNLPKLVQFNGKREKNTHFIFILGGQWHPLISLWVLTDQYRTGHGICAASLYVWGIRDDPLCACGSKQTYNVAYCQRISTDEIPWWASGASLHKRRFNHMALQAQHTLEEEIDRHPSSHIPAVTFCKHAMMLFNDDTIIIHWCSCYKNVDWSTWS